MANDDPKEPDSPDAPADDAAVDEDLSTSFGRLLGVLQKMVSSRQKMADWFSAWLPLVAALQSLAVTAGKLLWRARQVVAGEDDAPILDDEAIAEFQERLERLGEAFPEATAFFFGMENIDTLVREMFENQEARSVLVGFGQVVETRLEAVIERVIEWGIDPEGPELTLGRLEAFMRGLEQLLQEVLDRWVLPRLFGEMDQ